MVGRLERPLTGQAAYLLLEDGTVFRGSAFGAAATVFGELVFNTGMTGYQESLTDPSYAGQILTFTYPMIGNYGVNRDDFESQRVWPLGVVVREWCRRPSHRFATGTVDDFLSQEGVPGIEGLDTRRITVKTREHGTLKACVTTQPQTSESLAALLEATQTAPDTWRSNLVAEVSTKVPLHFPKGRYEGRLPYEQAATAWGDLAGERSGSTNPLLVLYDTGCKANIVRSLARRYDVATVPWNTSASDVRRLDPDAIFLGNGPGDPAHPEVVKHTVAAARALYQDFPVMGICLGHQLLSLMFGGRTYKLLYGHRGANQPVMDTVTKEITITSQNHGFAVDESSLPEGVQVTHLNVNDRTVEGLAHEELPIFCVQYHPEATPGPQDAHHLFDRLDEILVASRGGSPIPGIRAGRAGRSGHATVQVATHGHGGEP